MFAARDPGDPTPGPTHVRLAFDVRFGGRQANGVHLCLTELVDDPGTVLRLQDIEDAQVDEGDAPVGKSRETPKASAISKHQ
jgi:hypothetical protein